MSKFVLTFVAMIFAAVLTSGGDAHAQGIGGGGGGFEKINFKAKNPGCREGDTAWFAEQVPGTDRSVTVLRVCRSGSYFDLSEYVYNPKARCHREGRIEKWQDVLVRDEGRVKEIVVQCQDGAWVRIH